MEKKCNSCGMPMIKPTEFGGGKTDNIYCVHCCDIEGNLVSWDEKIEDFASFLLTQKPMRVSEAKEMAKKYLKDFPAWKDIE